MDVRTVVESVLVATVFALVTSYSWPFLRIFWITRKMPGPPIWRYLLYFITAMQGPKMIFKMFNYVIRTYGPGAVCVWGVPKVVIFISSPEDARLVLTHPLAINRDSLFCKAFDSVVAHGIISAKDDDARLRRKQWLAGFGKKTMDSYVEVFARKGEELCERLDKLAGGRTIEVKDEINITAVDTIFETAIGSRMNWPREEWERISQNMLVANVLMFRRLIRPWQLIDWIYALLSDGKKLRGCREVIISKLKQGFDKKNQMSNVIEEKTDFDNQIKHKSFTDIMRSTTYSFGPNLTDDQILEECVFILGSNMETIGKVMSYTLMMLGMHPGDQEKAIEEQRTIFKDSLRPASTEDLTKMPVLERVIKETLRLFPPVAGLTRELGADVEVTGGHTLPAGAVVIISNYMLHRNVKIFEEPESFQPDRWLEERGARHPYSYIPFARGVRSCIAQKYSYFQMMTILSRVLRQFRFTCGVTMRDLRNIEMNITNNSALGHKVEVFRRENMSKRGSIKSEILPCG